MSRSKAGLGESLHDLARTAVIKRNTSNTTNRSSGISLYLVLLLATVVGLSVLLAAAPGAASAQSTHANLQASAVAFNFPLLAKYAGMFALFVLPVSIWRWRQQRTAKRQKPANGPKFRADESSFLAAHEEERKHLSRELHDSVGQVLTAVGLQLRAIRSKSLSQDQLQLRLDETCRLNGEALRMVRDLARGLRTTLPQTGLAAALESQAHQLFDLSGIRISLQISQDLDALPEEQRMCIYRCVQEALTNCARHAHASSVRIAVHSRPDTVNVSVEDDGVGFDHQNSSAGLGLLGMRERVADVNGKLSINARRQGGTELRLEIPTARGTPA